MRYRKLGNSDLLASKVAFGAWAIGGWTWGGSDEAEAIRAIHAAIDAGINFFDTAPVYGFGRSEEILGKALKGKREKVIIATKCGLVWDKKAGEFHFRSTEETITDSGRLEIYKYLAPESLRLEVEKSLQRLQTDYIDLYQTHWPDNTTPIEETMAELVRLKKEGKIRAIGASNVSVEQLEKYQAIGRLDTDQEKFSLIDRQKLTTNIPWCHKHQVSFLAYSPLAQGLLTGKINLDREFPPSDLRSKKPRFVLENRAFIMSFLGDIQPIAERRNITLGQLAIAWVLNQGEHIHALVGARNVKQVQENAAAGEIVLSTEEVGFISKMIKKHGPNII
ncbi:MAG: aldo/keto reductase [Candidatus Omnitrophica bacterium]|nr:aldo/keto reductase [Candidatus Omnitrophota bacterium]